MINNLLRATDKPASAKKPQQTPKKKRSSAFGEDLSEKRASPGEQIAKGVLIEFGVFAFIFNFFVAQLQIHERKWEIERERERLRTLKKQRMKLTAKSM